MNINNLQPAKNLAYMSGVKGIFYGPPGSGKTPIAETAPRPVMLVCEPGMLSMKKSNMACFAAHTPKLIGEFMEWATKSAEMKAFDTICIDSGSEMAEIVLRDEQTKNKDGRKAYGNMSDTCADWLTSLYYLPNKHVYIICKQTHIETIETSVVAGVPQITTIRKAAPYFPGKDLPMKVSHKFDLVCQIDKFEIGGTRFQAIRCQESATVTARDRGGMFDEYEPPNLTALFKKAMS